MSEDDLAGVVAEALGATLDSDRLRRLAGTVADVNRRVADAANERLALDGSPWSFDTLRFGRAQEILAVAP
jgi:hypothetical protein